MGTQKMWEAATELQEKLFDSEAESAMEQVSQREISIIVDV